MSRKKSLTPAEHVELGALCKRIRRDCHVAAGMTGGKLRQQFLDLADAIPRGWLEERLVELVGIDGEVDGIRVRDVYREEMEASDA